SFNTSCSGWCGESECLFDEFEGFSRTEPRHVSQKRDNFVLLLGCMRSKAAKGRGPFKPHFAANRFGDVLCRHLAVLPGEKPAALEALRVKVVDRDAGVDGCCTAAGPFL